MKITRLVLLVYSVTFLTACISTSTIPELHASCGRDLGFSENLNCVQEKLRSDFRYKTGGAAFAEEYLASARVIEQKLLSKEITEVDAQKQLIEIYREMKKREFNENIYESKMRAEVELLNAQTESLKKQKSQDSREVRCDTTTNGRNIICREQ
ncbi:hypothetical protein [Sneathiella sp.]|uniref:hypothetical protein n=1 Tax=Sneathiella sp. TaxID=1964365 RepID=UPI002FE28D43